MRIVLLLSFTLLIAAKSSHSCSCVGVVDEFHDYAADHGHIAELEFIKFDSLDFDWYHRGVFIVRDTAFGFQAELGDTIYVLGSINPGSCLLSMLSFQPGDTMVISSDQRSDTATHPTFWLTVGCDQTYIKVKGGEYNMGWPVQTFSYGFDELVQRIEQREAAMQEDRKFNFYPNPRYFYHEPVVHFRSDGANVVRLSVYTLQGQLSVTQTYDSVEVAELPVRLPRGTYLVVAELSDGEKYTERFVMQSGS